MLVPIVRRLATCQPLLSITVLSQSKWKALWNNMPANVCFLGADLKSKHNGIGGLNTLLSYINFKQFDMVADMHNVWRSRYISMRCRLAGAHVKHLRKQRLGRWLLTHGSKRPLKPMQSAYCDVLLRLDLDIDFSTLQTDNILQTDKIITRENRSIGIAPFAAHKGKTYPIQKMEQVVNSLSAKGYKITLFGGRGKEAEILKLWADKYTNVQSVAGKLGLDEEIQLMSTLPLMLTMDSANMHLATLADTRVVSIWGATHPMAGFLPSKQSEDDCLQLPLSCRPCSIYGSKPCKYGDYRCLNISVESIVNHIDSVFNSTT